LGVKDLVEFIGYLFIISAMKKAKHSASTKFEQLISCTGNEEFCLRKAPF
jgi:hypothetical protein